MFSRKTFQEVENDQNFDPDKYPFESLILKIFLIIKFFINRNLVEYLIIFII